MQPQIKWLRRRSTSNQVAGSQTGAPTVAIAFEVVNLILHGRADDEFNLIRLQGIAPGHFVQYPALKEDVGIGK
jgi:hypothetical protein